MGTPLLDRINDRKDKPDPFDNDRWALRQPTPIRRPAWLRRMDELGLPPKDQTSTIKGVA